jgi:hypothetical protein
LNNLFGHIHDPFLETVTRPENDQVDLLFKSMKGKLIKPGLDFDLSGDGLSY